ncbi:hypothetical protein DSM110093_01268 [Sulfitobacter sp. DSM 110093]|uniref:DUF3307 domain-containing protein n=1 Tax=Sulfitobacter sp. DSM 110093 TaxID=2883127 RepID=UPI001FADE205|nr:DUF3307 domain-containing protein [Sulfitobacter sp. DSM 110093]UOA31503.1 hypothetical protein DSM110093_01268 [Sulfitobacter sp. DSM 110093]
MTEQAIATALACLLAHLLADFVFQTNAMVAAKRKPQVLFAHGLIVFSLTALALGGSLTLAALLALAHVGIDTVKTHAVPTQQRERLWPYLTDQATHLLSIAALALYAPDAFASGIWGEHSASLVPPALFAAGLITATLAGGPAVGGLMLPHKARAQPDGLENAGRIIGLLERALIFLMVLIGEPAGIGFLIAAKSILRFDTVKQNQKISEYVIIGTLASFGWALIAAFATKAAMNSF